MSVNSPVTFKTLALSDALLKALNDAGYETPSPIQAQSIPPLLEGHDLLGQAQTGTGKTAAFALPFLSNINISLRQPQILVLAPTRELAIQVAEAFQSYARYIRDFHVIPIYGGTGYEGQLRQLKRGVHAVVGTPGRVMDHIRKGTLKLDNLTRLVLDEADEMLRMGFIDDVEWILEHTPATRQTALFSATMPPVIRKVAERHLKHPVEIKIAEKTSTAKTIRQRFWQVNAQHKLDALTRILEVEHFDAVLIFVRTKTATVELSEKLQARGYASEPLNGDIQQKQRERTVDKLKKGQLDIVIATDVAARGLDVDRISHVINYDIPYDTETYVHRIGRTGRAGRSGEAILFVTSKERHLLKTIERSTRQSVEAFQMPSTSDINQQRINRFKQSITATIDAQDLDTFYKLVSDYQDEESCDPLLIAAALASMAQGSEPLLMSESGNRITEHDKRSTRDTNRKAPQFSTRALPLKDFPEVEMQRYYLKVGYQHDVKPGNIVGAIANEASIDSCYIGHIDIYDDFSLVDLPAEMPPEIYEVLKKTRVCGQKLDIELADKVIVDSSARPDQPKPGIKSRKKAVSRSKNKQSKSAHNPKFKKQHTRH